MPLTNRWFLDLIDPNQSGADVTHNTMIGKIDGLGLGGAVSVKNSTTTAPPASPSNGDRYLTGTGCTGSWAGHDTQIAVYYNGWYFFVVQYGTLIYDELANTLKLWQSTGVWRTL